MGINDILTIINHQPATMTQHPTTFSDVNPQLSSATMSFSPADSSEPSPDACAGRDTDTDVDKKMLGKKPGKNGSGKKKLQQQLLLQLRLQLNLLDQIQPKF